MELNQDDLGMILEESVLYDRMVPSRIYRTDLMLPRKRNVVLSVICKDIEKTMERIKSGKVLKLPPQYRYFVKQKNVTKRVLGKTSRVLVDKNAVREFCNKYHFTWLTEPMANGCSIVSLSDEMNMFFSRMKTRSIRQGIPEFLSYLNGCIPTIRKVSDQTNIIVIDAMDYLFTRNTIPNALKENPIYYLYYMLRNQIEAMLQYPYDIILIGETSSILLRPSEMDAKRVRQFFTNLFSFMSINQSILDKLEKELEREQKKNRREEDIQDLPTPNPYQTISMAVDKGNPKETRREPPAKAKEPEKLPAEKSRLTKLSTIEDDYDEPDPKKKPDANLFDAYSDEEDEKKSSSDEEEEEGEEKKELSDEDEEFVPYSDEDPFGYEAKKDKGRPRQAKIRSKVIEPGSKKQQELLKNQEKIVVRANKTVKN